jgi:Ubiquinol-cytochrome C reductase, UQCRX/QCR9 like
MYATFLISLIVIGEYSFKAGVNSLWNSVNRGRTFETVDWSHFDEVDDEEEEEADEEEEEDEDDDDE